MTTIEEKNRIIAEFMSIDKGIHEVCLPNGNWYDDRITRPNRLDGVYPMSSLKYHSSFDWIYPVITKIENLGCRFESFPAEMPDKNNYYIAKIRTLYNNRFQEQFFFGKIHDVRVMAYFEVVAEFCAWYNEKFDQTETN